MTTITDVEVLTLRRKIGRGGKGFSDPDLDSIWVEAGERMTKAIWICFEELMNDAARFNDYTQNETQEKRSQIFDHIAKVLVPYWHKKTEDEIAAENPTGRAARVMGTKVVPRRYVEKPYTDVDVDPLDPNWRRR